MKGFMIQGGDPSGTGKGGASIWGGAFDDEFHPQNRVRCSMLWIVHVGAWQNSRLLPSCCAQHNCRGIVSMANSGPNTNKQQFFITYAKQPHLNNVYTVFGKYVPSISRQLSALLTLFRLAPLTPSLYNKYPTDSLTSHTFSRVIDGFEALDAMEKTPVDAKNRPLKDIVIKSVTIHANPIADM